MTSMLFLALVAPLILGTSSPLAAYRFGFYSSADEVLDEESTHYSELAVLPGTPASAEIFIARTTDSLAVTAWEAQIVGTALDDEHFHVLGVTYFPEGSGSNAGSPREPKMGLGQCIRRGPLEAYRLARLQFSIDEDFGVGSLMLLGSGESYQPRISLCDGETPRTMMPRSVVLIRNGASEAAMAFDAIAASRILPDSEFPSNRLDVVAGIGQVTAVRTPSSTRKGRFEQRHVSYDPYEGERQLGFAECLLEEPSNRDQKTYEQTSVSVSEGTDSEPFSAGGFFDTSLLEQTLEESGHSLGERIEQLQDYYTEAR